MQNFQQQYSRKVITGSFEDHQHMVYAQIKIITLTHICRKIEQISKNNMKSVKQASNCTLIIAKDSCYLRIMH